MKQENLRTNFIGVVVFIIILLIINRYVGAYNEDLRRGIDDTSGQSTSQE